jgi:hypothetical protein
VTCGPQKLDQTYRLPELRERTPLLWATTKSLPDFCRSELCTVVHGRAVCNGRDRKLRTRGSWVQVLPGAPNFKDLTAKTKSSFFLWDRFGTFYPLVRLA